MFSSSPSFPTLPQARSIGQMLYARYDQMMPHYIIEEAMKNSLNQAPQGSFTRTSFILVDNVVNGCWNIFQVQSALLTWDVSPPVFPKKFQPATQ